MLPVSASQQLSSTCKRLNFVRELIYKFSMISILFYVILKVHKILRWWIYIYLI